MKNKLTILLISIMMITGLTMAAGENLNPAKTNSDNIQQSEGHKANIFDSLTGLLAVTSGQDVYSPGETGTFEIEAVTETEYNTEGKTKVVEFYRCADSGCDDPDQDEFLESDTDTVSFSANMEVGQSWIWDVDYTVPNEEGYYAVVGYVSDSDSGTVLTETPNRKIFEVRSSTDDSTDSGSADVSLSSTPSYSVNEEQNSVTGTLGIQNTGDAAMPDGDIIEMQVRPYGEGPLSFTSSQSVCDSSYPNNVHKEYSIDAGDSRTISLNADSDLKDGEKYTVYFLTREGCGGEKTEPIYNSYNAGTFTFEDSTDDTDTSEDASVVQQSKPKVSLNDGTITTEVGFKNEGGPMESDRILEMQVRPKGSNPLSFSSTTSVCDTAYPENVHKSFKIDSGETASTTLSTDAVTEEGEYTVYLLTRSSCGGEKVEPYYNSVRAGTVTIQSDGTGFVEFAKDNPVPTSVTVLGLVLVAGGVLIRWV